MRLLTSAPLPTWRDLLSALASRTVSDDVLAAPWCLPGDKPLWFSRTSWSLAAVVRWRQLLASREKLTVWVPDYFCNAALTPLRDTGVRLVFYPITAQWSPDSEACEKLAREHIPDIVLLVHYFGQPVPVEPIADLCRRHGAWFVEDAAHVLRPRAGIGEAGDCVLYSPHKHLPIPDGAVMIVRRNGPARLTTQPSAMNALPKAVAAICDRSGELRRCRTVWWLIKRLLQLVGLRSRKKAADFRSDPGPGPLDRPEMSVLGRRLLAQLLPAMDMVAGLREERLRNWRHVLSLAGLSASPLSAAATPYLAGFSCAHEADAAAAFDSLQREGLPVVTWPDLPPEVTQRPELHGAAIVLRRTRFYLPVHQTLQPEGILACGRRLLDTATRQWRSRPLSKEEWGMHWRQSHGTNLLQSWQYGAAKEKAEGWKPHRLLVSDDADRPVAIVQILSRELPGLGGVARLNRGPIMLPPSKGVGPLGGLAALRVLLREARRRHWWMLQVAPELPSAGEGEMGLRILGFRKLPLLPWESALVSLEAEEPELLMRLNGKWRNCMRKGERLGVTVERHRPGREETDLLLSSYRELQGSRGFEGLSENLIRALVAQDSADWRFNLFIARRGDTAPDGKPVGMLVTVESGDTAIYLIGLTNDDGRRLQANSVLLWQAILHAKSSNCSWFDLGGLGEATPSGIAEFKRGLNGASYKLVGEWRGFFL